MERSTLLVSRRISAVLATVLGLTVLTGCSFTDSDLVEQRATTSLVGSLAGTLRFVQDNFDQLASDPGLIDRNSIRVNVILNPSEVDDIPIYWTGTLFSLEVGDTDFVAGVLVEGSGNDSTGFVTSNLNIYGCARIDGKASADIDTWVVADMDCPDWLNEEFMKTHRDSYHRSVETAIDQSKSTATAA